MTSVNTKVKQIAALHDTSDVTQWENEFIASIVERTQGGMNTGMLMEKQLEIIDRIWRKHYAA